MGLNKGTTCQGMYQKKNRFFCLPFSPTLNIYNALPILTLWILFCIGGTNIVWPKLIGDIGIGPLLSKTFTVIPLQLIQRFNMAF